MEWGRERGYKAGNGMIYEFLGGKLLMIRKLRRFLNRKVTCGTLIMLSKDSSYKLFLNRSLFIGINRIMSVSSLNPFSLHLYLKMFLWFQMCRLPILLFAADPGSSFLFCRPCTCRNVTKMADTYFRVL